MTEKQGNRESGQSFVEAALVLPLLILCFNAIVDIGWVIFNRVDFDNMATVAVRANPKENQMEAEDFMTHYISENYNGYDAASMTLNVETKVKEYYYDEYVWKFAQRRHWQVPMYFKILYTKMEVTREVPYLTPFGSMMFGGNSIVMKTNAVAVRALENGSMASKEEDEDEEDEDI